MSEHRTRPLEPYGADDPYEWDQEAEPEPGPKILWGRVAALVGFVILAFLLGRVTAGGADEAVAERLRAQVENLSDENEQLRAELDAARAIPAPEPDATDAPDEEAAAEEPEGETYVVRRGDTLRGVAERFYGDVTLDDCIAAANGIDDPTELSVGRELVIPDQSDC